MIFVNALVGKEEKGIGSSSGGSGKDSTSKSGKGSSFFSSEMMTYLMFPASIGAVYYY